MDKAVILARGLGTRMRQEDNGAEVTAGQAAMADVGLKAMIPIDRPFLDYVLSDLADAGYKGICLVIGPEHNAVRKYYRETIELNRLKIEFAIQEKPLGTANAVAAAEGFADGEPILVINSDNYYPPESLRALRETEGNALAAFERDAMFADSNITPERLNKFAVVEINAEGYMSKIIEKPDEQTLAGLKSPVCVSMNCWRFTAAIFEACRSISPSARGEYEIPDAVDYTMHSLGQRFRAIQFNAPVLDMSYRSDVPGIVAKLTGNKVEL